MAGGEQSLCVQRERCGRELRQPWRAVPRSDAMVRPVLSDALAQDRDRTGSQQRGEEIPVLEDLQSG